VDIFYLIIAAAIVALPFLLSKLFSGSSRDTQVVLGASPAPKKPASPHRAPARTQGAPVETDEKADMTDFGRQKTHYPTEADGSKTQAAVQPQGIASAMQSITSMLKLARDVIPEVRRLAKQGQKIEAIKLLRERTGMGLNEAKTIVDKFG
jgi:ribosomal L7/L12-like protein